MRSLSWAHRTLLIAEITHEILARSSGYPRTVNPVASTLTSLDGNKCFERSTTGIVSLCRKALFQGSSHGVAGSNSLLTSPGIRLADGGGGEAHCWSSVFGEWQRWTVNIH